MVKAIAHFGGLFSCYSASFTRGRFLCYYVDGRFLPSKDIETMSKTKQEPIVVGDIIKIATWLLTFVISANYLTPEEGEQVQLLIPSIAAIVAILVNGVLAWYQRQNVTPWQPTNPLVKYPEDPTPY